MSVHVGVGGVGDYAGKDGDLIEIGARAAWDENIRHHAEFCPTDPLPLSEEWDAEPEGLRQYWRRLIGAAFKARAEVAK